jgi:hypothetical protein
VFLLLQNVFSLPTAHAAQARADARPLQHALEHNVFLLLQNVFSLSLLLAQGALKALADAPPPAVAECVLSAVAEYVLSGALKALADAPPPPALLHPPPPRP